MIDERYHTTLECLKVFTDLVECEVCPFKNMCQDNEVSICDIMIDEIYEIEYKINMEA
ncbi:MAG: hypothetical protein E6356_16925 [Terrisporobacter othiniensis]|nr:hypothetical protein [Terrisporobacter othiniensis]